MKKTFKDPSFQEQGSVVHCFGCGADNQKGLRLKSYWDGDQSVAQFVPMPYHCGGSKNIVYGGLLASLMDCHSCNFAIARYYKLEKRAIGSLPRIRCVTAQLNISLIKPTPIEKELNLRAKIISAEGRKTWVGCEITANNIKTAHSEILVIRIDDDFKIEEIAES